jgi:hypothetical protein
LATPPLAFLRGSRSASLPPSYSTTVGSCDVVADRVKQGRQWVGGRKHHGSWPHR